jgi:biopolymer transport protein ExbD
VKIRTNRTALAGLESFAITDIILNMFIFFFTSFSLVYTFNPTRESRIHVKLPQADVRTPAKQKEPIEVTIDAGARVYLAGKPVALSRLAGAISATRSRIPGPSASASPWRRREAPRSAAA